MDLSKHCPFGVISAVITCMNVCYSTDPECAMVQVKVQTSPGFAKGISDGMPKFIQQEGVAG